MHTHYVFLSLSLALPSRFLSPFHSRFPSASLCTDASPFLHLLYHLLLHPLSRVHSSPDLSIPINYTPLSLVHLIPATLSPLSSSFICMPPLSSAPSVRSFFLSQLCLSSASIPSSLRNPNHPRALSSSCYQFCPADAVPSPSLSRFFETPCKLNASRDTETRGDLSARVPTETRFKEHALPKAFLPPSLVPILFEKQTTILGTVIFLLSTALSFPVHRARPYKRGDRMNVHTYIRVLSFLPFGTLPLTRRLVRFPST